jgi:signal transduction histidine kinase
MEEQTTRSFWQQLPKRELGLLAGFYVVFAVFYACSLYFSIPEEYNPQFPWSILYLQYPLKALFTLPIWYLIFRVLRHWSLTARVTLNVLLLPVYVKGWQQIHYVILEALNLGRLRGNAEWWDIYIPSLFYVLQFGIFHAYDYYTNLQRTRLDKARAEQLALKSELTALKAQLNPHFLYNTFNTISASVPPGQEYTRELIATLADLFRYQLRATRTELVTLGEELEFINNYLNLEKARYGDRLRVSIAVAEELRLAQLPPMLLQPLVENAIRHGIAPKMAGGEVRIAARAIKDRLEIEIADDGAGADPEALAQTEGFGLANTRRRLDLLYQETLHIVSPGPGGLLLRFRIPLTYATKSTTDRRRGAGAPIAAGVPE